MHEVRVTETGTFQVTNVVELTDEQWADAVDPATGLVTDVGVIAEEAFRQETGGHSVCTQCSGWGRNFSLSLDDETEIVEISNVASGEIIYDANYTDELVEDDVDEEVSEK